MARVKETESLDRRLPYPLDDVWLLVSDPGRQDEWIVGEQWSSCRVKHASGPLRGPGAIHIRVLVDAVGKERVDRVETTEFDDDERVAFSDGRVFEVDGEGDGTVLTCGHETVRSNGPLMRRMRKAIKAESELFDRDTLAADLERIERALAAEAAADAERAEREAAERESAP